MNKIWGLDLKKFFSLFLINKCWYFSVVLMGVLAFQCIKVLFYWLCIVLSWPWSWTLMWPSLVHIPTPLELPEQEIAVSLYKYHVGVSYSYYLINVEPVSNSYSDFGGRLMKRGPKQQSMKALPVRRISYSWHADLYLWIWIKTLSSFNPPRNGNVVLSPVPPTLSSCSVVSWFIPTGRTVSVFSTD